MSLQDLRIETKFLMSGIITEILNLEDNEVNVSDIKLKIDYNTYPDLIYKMKYFKKEDLLKLKEDIEKDYNMLLTLE